MEKQYVSVLDLLNEVSKRITSKSEGYAFPLEMYVRQFANMPLFMIQKRTLAGEEKQIQLITSRSEITSLIRGNSYRMPYLLELEYIRDAQLGLSRGQLNLLNELFLITVLGWAAPIGMHYTFQNENDIYHKLEEGGKLISIDPNTKEGKEEIKRRVEEVYEKDFDVLELSSPTIRKKHLRMWGAYPRSTKDAFKILSFIYQQEDASLMSYQDVCKDAYLGQALLFTPFILIFYLLEKQKNAYRKISWGEYQSWKKDLPDYLDPEKYRKSHHSPDRNLFTVEGSMTPRDQYGNPLETFSYGYVSYRMNRGEQNDDQAFLLWLFDLVFRTIRKEGVNRNVTEMPIQQLEQYTKNPERIEQMGKVRVLLNQEILTWGVKEEDNE